MKHDFHQRELLFAELGRQGVYPFGSQLGAYQRELADQLVERPLSHGGQVLDWGTGSGHFSLFLLSSGARVSACRVSSASELADDLKAEFGDAYELVAGDDPIARLRWAQAIEGFSRRLRKGRTE